MISHQLLSRYARGSGVGLGVFEKDYILSCVLSSLPATSHVGENFVFKGGTALRKVYFSDWRYSEDLDFSVLPDFDSSRLKELVELWLSNVSKEHEFQIRIRDYHKTNGSARMRAQFVGPLGYPNQILLDVTLEEPIILGSKRCSLSKTFPESPGAQISVYRLEEILAEKLRTILQRGKSRDYYDVWRLLKEKEKLLDLNLTAKVFEKKCAHRGIILRSPSDFVREEKLSEVTKYWDEGLRGQIGRLPEFCQIIDELKVLLKKLPL